jgi:hypothetical protein
MPTPQFLTGDYVRTKTWADGRVEGWSGRYLVLVRITHVPRGWSSGPTLVEGAVGVFTPDQLTLTRGVDD